MAADLYCSRSDVTKRLPAGAVVSVVGVVESSLAATDVITFDGHGLETDDVVSVRAADGGTLSAPFVAGTNYYAIRLSNSTFKLAATAGGAALDITTNGTSMFVTREPDFETHIEFYSRWCDSFFVAHTVPFTPGAIPALVRGITADLSAKKILNIAGQDSAVLNAAEVASKAMLERHVKGIPVRDANATSSASSAIVTSLVSTDTDPRGWGTGTLP